MFSTYTKKPPSVIAMEWLADSTISDIDVEFPGCQMRPHPEDEDIVQLETSDGWTPVLVGNFVVVRDGALCVFSAEEFAAQYEAAQ